ncbi:MAG: 3'-5' exoribonuclease [Rhodocyclales bacterium]|nr:3'-5' exoribonuclease [Rhodocyclales bacterium]
MFFDTEFTGIDQRYPRLISIGLVSEDGLRDFYAELEPEGYLPNVTPWVRENVLPLLDNGEKIAPIELTQRLGSWLAGFDEPVQMATDSLQYDWPMIQAIFYSNKIWPANLDRRPLILAQDPVFNLAVEEAFAKGLRRHHALDDAKANRLGWIAVGGNIEKRVRFSI